MGVETLSATWAANQTGKDNGDDQENNPGGKNDCDPGFIVR